MKIKIEKNVPLWDKWFHPSKNRKGLGKYLDKMKVGDSFATEQNQQAVNMYVKRFAENDEKKRKFTTRKDVNKTRVWRIK